MNEQQAQDEVQRQMAMEEQISSLLNAALTSDARLRMNNIKMSNKGLYLKAVQAISYFMNSEQGGKIDDSQLKSLLEQLSYSTKKEFKIKRK